MKESFLCYESGDSLFLIMLDAVLHILEAPANGQECVKFQDQEIPVQDFCRRFGGWPREESRYAVLLKAGERIGGFLAEQILGVCELEVERFKVLPREVRGQGGWDGGSGRRGSRLCRGPAAGGGAGWTQSFRRLCGRKTDV